MSASAQVRRPRDMQRLNRQAQAAYNVMADGQWRTLPQISSEASLYCRCPEASASARLRDLKKPKFGGLPVEKECLGGGLWRYRMILPKGQLALL